MLKRMFYSVVICWLVFASSGCTKIRQTNLPKRPEQVRGWNEKTSDGIHSTAELLVDQGQSSEGAVFGVEVVKISPYKSAAHVWDDPINLEAVLRFYKISDHTVIAEVTISCGAQVTVSCVA